MTTALALVPRERSLVFRERSLVFRRCTGHCCDPVKIPISPGEIAGRPRYVDQAFFQRAFVYLRWVSAAQDSRGYSHFEYRCRYFDRAERRCTIYGTGQRGWICRRHPEYGYGLWEPCGHDNCTRRTMVIGGRYPLRWRFPDLWRHDYFEWQRTKPWLCEAVAAPEVGYPDFEE